MQGVHRLQDAASEAGSVQVWLPDNGSRLLIGSDGVWDAFDTNSRICKMVRGLPPQVRFWVLQSLADIAWIGVQLVQQTSNCGL